MVKPVKKEIKKRKKFDNSIYFARFERNKIFG